MPVTGILLGATGSEPGGHVMREYPMLTCALEVRGVLAAPYLILDEFVELLMPYSVKEVRDSPSSGFDAWSSWLN